jgi:TRAP-type C4-dicarboxylate transport system permease small subunit
MTDLFKKFTRIQLAMAGCALIMMICLTCANILLRQFGMPVRGTFEVMGFMGALIFALSFGYSHEKKEHIYVSILFDRFPPKVQRAARRINSLLTIVFFALLSFQLVKNALNLKAVEEVSETLRIAYYPVILVLAFGAAYLVLLIILELFKPSGDPS